MVSTFGSTVTTGVARAVASASATVFDCPSLMRFIFVGKMIVQRLSPIASIGLTHTESTDSDPS